MPYKIIENEGSISIQKDNMSIPRSIGNRHYRQFLEDVAIENDTVEGPDVRSPGYAELREAAYPSLKEQLDMQYWDGVNGTSTWADAIQAVKDQYPTTIEETITVGDVPETITEEIAQWLFDYQLEEYSNAVARLAQYRLADGRDDIYEDVTHEEPVMVEETRVDEEGNEYTVEVEQLDENGDIVMQEVTKSILVYSAIDPLPATVTEVDIDGNETEVPNPAIVEDDESRSDAQAIIDATPQEVIDAHNA
jgi:hypothetical protein